MPSTKDLLKARIAALKAEIEPDSISPLYLGGILDDMVDEHPDRLSHITIAGAPDSVTVSVGTQDHSVSGKLPAATDQFAGIMSAAMKRKLDKAAVPEYIEFDGFADRVTARKQSVSFGSSADGYKVVFVRELNTFLLCHGIPDPDDGKASGYNNWMDGDDFGAISENGRVPYPKTLYLDRSTGIAYRLAGDKRQLVSMGAGIIRFKGFYFSGSQAQQSSSGMSSASEGYSVKFMQSTGHLVLAKDDVLNTYWGNWVDAHLFGIDDGPDGYKPFPGRIYLDESSGIPYIADVTGLTPFSIGIASLAVDDDAEDIENIHLQAFDVHGEKCSDVAIPNSEIRRRVVFFDGMQPPLAAGQLLMLDFMTKVPLSSGTSGCKVYYDNGSFLLTQGEFFGNALKCWSDWNDAVAFMDLNSESAAERNKPYYDRIYIDRSTGLIYIRKNDAGELMQLGSRFSSLSLDDSDKRNYLVKALDASGAVIASVSIPKPAKAPESPVRILAKGICRPTSDPRYAYRLHKSTGVTAVYKLPYKHRSEQLRLKYMPEYGPDISVFDISNLLDFDSSAYNNKLSWIDHAMSDVNTVLKKILSGWEKDGVRVSAETYTEESAPAGWMPVWTHHLVILRRYEEQFNGSFMLGCNKGIDVPNNVYIYRGRDGMLKQTYNVVLQQGASVADDITLSIIVYDRRIMEYNINGHQISAYMDNPVTARNKKRLRRNCRYEIQWCRRRSSKHAWDSEAFSAAIRARECRHNAFLRAREVGNVKDGKYIKYNRWSSHAIPNKSGIVRIRRRATEGAPAGRWNYFIVRDLDMTGAAWVAKIREDVKRLGVVERQ